MVLGDLFNKITNSLGFKSPQAKKLAAEQEAARIAAEQKAAKEKATAERKAAAERKKAEEMARILAPTCSKGDCLWNSGGFYYTCEGSEDCPRIKSTKLYCRPIKHPELWSYMKRMEEVERLSKDNKPIENIVKALTKELLDEFMPKFKPYSYRIANNIQYHGIADNAFFNLLWDMKDVDFKHSDYKIKILEERYPDCFIGLNLDYDFYRNPSLYDRSDDDFVYTIKILELVMNEKKLSQYYVDTSNISLDQLLDADGNIKPAGIGGPKEGFYGDTIWNTLISWGGEHGNNECFELKGSSDYVDCY